VLSRQCGQSIGKDVWVPELILSRAMDDADGPRVAKSFYERLFAAETITLDAIPYALDNAVTELRRSGVPPERWATFVHIGA
jgi:hypothetical protein